MYEESTEISNSLSFVQTDLILIFQLEIEIIEPDVSSVGRENDERSDAWTRICVRLV